MILKSLNILFLQEIEEKMYPITLTFKIFRGTMAILQNSSIGAHLAPFFVFIEYFVRTLTRESEKYLLELGARSDLGWRNAWRK